MKYAAMHSSSLACDELRYSVLVLGKNKCIALFSVTAA